MCEEIRKILERRLTLKGSKMRWVTKTNKKELGRLRGFGRLRRGSEIQRKLQKKHNKKRPNETE